MNETLLYGKNYDYRQIVSIEVKNEEATLFTQYDDKIDEVTVKNRYWILSNSKINENFVLLKGNQYYKYGIQFDKKSDFIQCKMQWKDRDIYCINNAQEALMVKDGYTYYQDLLHNKVDILAFDIETTTLDLNSKSKVILIANTFRDRFGKITRKIFCYDDFFTEGEMIDAWCDWVRDINPSILCGHNIFSYDLPYLNFIANKYNTSIKLGRDNSDIKFDKFDSKFRKDGNQFYPYKKCRVFGREIVDTLFLAIRYDTASRKYESYGLKNIIKQEGLENPNRVFYDASTIKDNYLIPEELEKIKQYASFDGDDALALYDLMAAPFFYMARNIPKTFQEIICGASGSQLNSIMMRAYLQDGYSLPKENEANKYEGAISFGEPGLYRNVMKVDVASLYPSIMIEYEIYDKVKDPNAYLLQLLNTFRTERLKYKKLAKETGDLYYKHMEQSGKIFINSLYGFLGSSGLLFNYPFGASEVTRHGREILSKALDWARKKEFIIANGDTDSISFCKKDMSAFSKTEQEFLLNDLNSYYPENIQWEHDGIYTTFLIVGAKNYVWETEDGERKFKGSALKSPVKEKRLIDFIEDFVELIIYDQQKYIPKLYNTYAKEILNLKSISGWCSKKTITDKVLTPSRTNEKKILDALEGQEGLQQGDKKWFFFKSDNTLCLEQNFDGDYSKKKLLEKLYKSALIFNKVYDVKSNLLNYTLKRNEKILETL